MSLIFGLIMATTAPATVDTSAYDRMATGPTEILPSEMPESQVILYTDSYREMEDGSRRIAYSATFPHPDQEIKGKVTLEGIVEVKCAARTYRHIHMKYTDEKGVTQPAPQRFAPDRWDDFINDHDDKIMYKRLCGTDLPSSEK